MKTTTVFTFLSRRSADDHKVLYHVFWDHVASEYEHDCMSDDDFAELMDNLHVDAFADRVRMLKHAPAWTYDFKTYAGKFKRFSESTGSKERLLWTFQTMCCHMLEVDSTGEVHVAKNRYGRHGKRS